MSRYNKHIIIVGSARSGTSWLSETMAQRFRYRLLFEPDHDQHVPEAKVLTDRFVNKHDIKHKELHRFLNKVFRNTIDNNWIAQNSNRKYKMHLWPWLPKKYIIKCIRSGLAIKHINEHFKIPVIHILRNPYEVLASQHRVKFPWLYDLTTFQNQPQLVDFIKSEVNFDITSSFNAIETLAIRWCIENVIVLKHQEPYTNKHRVVKYEDLKNDIDLFRDLCRDFNIQPVDNLSEIYYQPSSKTHPKSTIRSQNNNNDKKPFTKTELEQINTVLEHFQQDFYPLRSYSNL